jgi:hypothetical protein
MRLGSDTGKRQYKIQEFNVLKYVFFSELYFAGPIDESTIIMTNEIKALNI